METRGAKRLHAYFTSDAQSDTDLPNTDSGSSQPPKVSRKVPKIFDGKYFEVINHDVNDNVKAKCVTCNEMKNGNTSSTGNFFKHYEKKHPLQLNELKLYTKKKDNLSQKSENTKSSQQRTLPFGSKEDISQYILDFTIGSNVSYNVGLSPSMQRLLETVSRRKIIMPSRYGLMKSLDSRFVKMKNILKEHLSKQKYLCATTDVWSSRAQSYLGVTIHFINSEFKRESYLIGFKQLNFKQTYDELGRKIHEIFADYGIKTQQLTNIVTDGGSNFCKMFKIYGKELTAFEYVNDDPIEDDVVVDMDEQTEPRTTQFMEDNGELFAAEVLDFANPAASTDETNEEATSNYFGEDDNYTMPCTIELPPQARCMPHKFNLVSKDFRKRLSGMAKNGLNNTLEKLNTLWVLTHRSSYAKSICLDILKHCLPTPTETRWNSEFDAVKFCNRPDIINKLNPLIKELKNKLKCKSALNLQILTSQDMTVITQYIKVMEPVACALDVLQKEFNGSQGYILPVLHSMKRRMDEIESNTNIARDFKSAMLEAINYRFSHYFLFNDTNRHLLLASLTLPQIQTNFIENDDDIIFAKNLLINECKKLKIGNSEVEQCAPQKSTDDFLISFAEQRNHRRTSYENAIESEVSRYLMDSRTEYAIFNEFPHVCEIYYMYNTTLSSSAPVERVFSQSTMIYTPRRNRISGEHFEKTLLLKHNRQLLEENDVNIVTNVVHHIPLALP